MRTIVLAAAASAAITAGASPASTTTPRDMRANEAMAAVRGARVFSDHFYKIGDCRTGMGFTYGYKRLADGFIVLVTPPDPRRPRLRIGVHAPDMRIVGVQRIAR